MFRQHNLEDERNDLGLFIFSSFHLLVMMMPRGDNYSVFQCGPFSLFSSPLYYVGGNLLNVKANGRMGLIQRDDCIILSNHSTALVEVCRKKTQAGKAERH